MSSDSNRLLLVDGSNFLFRAYHAMPNLTTKSGQPTGAIRGMIVMLSKLMKQFNPQFMGVVFDASGETFRHQLYNEYKAHRPPMPDDLREQIAPLHEIIRLMGLPLIIQTGIEADDVIATLSIQAQSQNVSVTIASSDKDLAQLVNEQVILYDGMKELSLDRQGVFDKYGVYPEQIRDLLALMGDKSDNIPGVDGVGPKTAAKWLNQYGSLENLIQSADEIGGKVGEKLRASLTLIPLSVQLTTLHTTADLPVLFTDLVIKPADILALDAYYQQLEFNQLRQQLHQNQPDAETHLSKQSTTPSQQGISKITLNHDDFIAPNVPMLQTYHCIDSTQSLDDFLNQLTNVAYIAMTAVYATQRRTETLQGLAFSISSGQAYFLPYTLPDESDLSWELAITALKPILESEAFAKIGHNLKVLAKTLSAYDVQLQGLNHDTMLMSYVLESTKIHHADFNIVANTYLDAKACELIATAPTLEDSLSVWTQYACAQADLRLQLLRALWPRLTHSPLQSVYQSIELPLLPVLMAMENSGILLDVDYLQTLSTEFASRLLTLEENAYQMAGEPFNLASSKQLAEILFERLHLPIIKKTPKGQPSTDEEVLTELAIHYPLPQIILQHRSLAKLNSTYTQALIQQVDPVTQRVHTHYQQALTSTGRLSSIDPNLQNIPIKTSEGRRIRQAFIAAPDCQLLSADYSQIELRLMAHFSEDPTLIDAFKAGEDIHRLTASEVFNTPFTEVTSEQRRAAKAINFGLIYGMGAFGLSRQLGISRTEAKQYIDTYFSRYPQVLQFMESMKEMARSKGFVSTLTNRRLYLADIHHGNANVRQGAERLAINAPLQGSAADIIKLAMIEVYKQLQKQSLKSALLLQVHDELVLEVPTAEIASVQLLLQQVMTSVMTLRVPLEVSIGVGQHWDAAH